MKSHRWTLILFLALTLLLGGIVPARAAPTQQSGGDYAIPGGRFYTQTAGGNGGFSVLDDGQARFWSEFQRLGGLQTIGYPISRRFTYDGFTTQAFQKLVLQWRPEVGQAWPVNVFDELSRKGFNQRLYEMRQTPFPLENLDPPGATWPQIVSARQGLLNANPAIRARYFSVADPLNVFGLPVSRVEDMGNHYAIRTQRAVFQQWKEAVPWAAAGQVTIANGGDIAKELGWLSGQALQPEPAPNSGNPPPVTPPTYRYEIVSMTMEGTPSGRVYALFRQLPVTVTPVMQLRYSDDLGRTWYDFPGQLPNCMVSIEMDYQRRDALYAITCDGIYAWNVNQWTLHSSRFVYDLAIAYGQPDRAWGAAGDGGGLLYSEDGGRNWRQIDQSYLYRVAVDPRDNAVLYGTVWGRYSPPQMGRANPTSSGGWQAFPYPEGRFPLSPNFTLDGQTGHLYTTTTFGSGDTPIALWRVSNPREADTNAIRWEKVHDFGRNWNVDLLASGREGNNLVLFANFDSVADPSGANATHRSTDGGTTWVQIYP